jgi:hypothetical protein
MRSRRIAGALLVVGLALTAACGTEPDGTPRPAALPLNDTPRNAVLRFIAAFEQKKGPEFAALFTGDFTFRFSNATDPDLASRWSIGWFAIDESIAAAHLFGGGLNQEGKPVPAAAAVDLIFSRTEPLDDTEGRDPARYRVLPTTVDAVIVVAPQGDDGPTRYVVTGATHRFFLVRGDAAVDLGPGQPADSTRWYFWSWYDETTAGPASPGGAPVAEPAQPTPTRTTTWGSLKGLYR